MGKAAETSALLGASGWIVNTDWLGVIAVKPFMQMSSAGIEKMSALKSMFSMSAGAMVVSTCPLCKFTQSEIREKLVQVPASLKTKPVMPYRMNLSETTF